MARFRQDADPVPATGSGSAGRSGGRCLAKIGSETSLTESMRSNPVYGTAGLVGDPNGTVQLLVVLQDGEDGSTHRHRPSR